MKNISHITCTLYNLKYNKSVEASNILHNTLQNSARGFVWEDSCWVLNDLVSKTFKRSGRTATNGRYKENPWGFAEVAVLTTMLCHKSIVCYGDEMLFLGLLHRIDASICEGNVIDPIEASWVAMLEVVLLII